MNWHTEIIDEYGNVRCLECGKKQSPSFDGCIYCCEHNHTTSMEIIDENSFGEVYYYTKTVCDDCGKNFDLEPELTNEP